VIACVGYCWLSAAFGRFAPMSEVKIHQFGARQDNYGVLIHDPVSGETVSIDAPDGAEVLAQLAVKGWRLTQILVTHHHGDHTAGNLALKAATGCTIIGPQGEAARIPGLDRGVVEGDRVAFGGAAFEVMATPGHTLGHISYWLPTAKAAFVGDTLFAMGCGRVMEGDYPMMWSSIQKIAHLPAEALIYCGHEYSAANARFALGIEPGNAALQVRARAVNAGTRVVPMLLADELATNPFLRADHASIRRHLGLDTAPAWQVFGAIRDLKNAS
jgi:hydroxyacylglutathione hydrolase